MGNRRKPVKKGGGGGGGGVVKQKKAGASKDQAEARPVMEDAPIEYETVISHCSHAKKDYERIFHDVDAFEIIQQMKAQMKPSIEKETKTEVYDIGESPGTGKESAGLGLVSTFSENRAAESSSARTSDHMNGRISRAKEDLIVTLETLIADIRAERPFIESETLPSSRELVEDMFCRLLKSSEGLTKTEEVEVEVGVPILVGTHENNSSSSKRLLCVICHCSHNTSPLSLDKFNIFIVDLNGGGGGSSYVKRVPNIRLQGFDHTYMFCNIGSDLYMLKGGSGDRPVFKYALDNADPLKSEIVVEKSLEPYSHILNPKRSPAVAIPTPDDKILVFSLHVYFHDLPLIKEDKIRCQPELFDPKTKSWTLLPPLCIRQIETDSNYEILDGSGSWTKFGRTRTPIRSRSDSFRMTSYFFISKSTLLVRIVSKSFEAEDPWLTLDIHSLDQGWKLYDGWNICKDDPHKFVNEMLMVNNGRIDRELLLPVGFKFPPIEEYVSNQRMILSDYVKVKDKEFCFAVASAGPEMYSYTRSFLIVDEWEYEFTEAGVSTGTCTCTPKKQIKPPFKFVISDVCGYFFIHSAFMLPQPSFLI